MEITSASFAYPRLDTAIRSRVARALEDTSPLEGVFVLSTCLRVEVVVAGDEADLKEAMAVMFDPLPADPEVRTGAEAVDHIFRVAAGHESPIIGELEVLTQFRQAVAELRGDRQVEGRFLKLLESAVASGREARDLMGSSPHDTMAVLAAQMVGHARSVAVIGSGTMARAVVDALEGLPAPPEVAIVARDLTKAKSMGAAAVSLDRLDEVLSHHPAIVSATAASTRLISDDRLQSALARRATPLTLVDMAMPPDFALSDAPDVVYVSIDDLASMAARRAGVEGAADHVLAAAAEAFHRYRGQGRTGPVIASIVARADSVVDEAVERFAGRLQHPGDREVLRQAAHTVARTLIDRPVAAVRTSRDPGVVDTLSAVFDDG